jgi:hypothetical protein
MEESQYLSLYCDGAPATVAVVPTTASGLAGGAMGSRTRCGGDGHGDGECEGDCKV